MDSWMEKSAIDNCEWQLQKILEQTFGFKEFRAGQKETITTLLTHGRVLCIQPTGHGKSLLYQLPACLLGGLTIVISPLLALMRDQIDHLNNRFKIPSAAINSDQTDGENALARRDAAQGKVRVLFVAPEQLDHVDRFDFLLSLDVRLLVVDEAHCISTWGHDFRPSYRQIVNFSKAVHAKNPDIKILGLTATANESVEKDISRQLTFSTHKVAILRETMNRPNIQLSALEAKGFAAKLAACEELLKQLEGCGLVYCATRENTELVADFLRQQKFPVAAYHAGFEQSEKRKLQKEFIEDKYKALVATNALGMGIDKGNLRYIIHFDVPGSITAYYQEVGRCGRDGKKAQGILLYDPADKKIHEYFIDSAQPKKEDFDKVLDAVRTAESAPNLTLIKRLTGLHPTRVTIVIAELLEQNFLDKFSKEGLQVYRVLRNEKALDLSRYINQYKVKSQELKNMLNYADLKTGCRMGLLRQTLGDQDAQPCQQCDLCSKTSLQLNFSAEKLKQVNDWLDNRPIPIAPAAKEKISAGISVLDGKMRSPLFINFMRQRGSSQPGSLGMEEELLLLLKKHLSSLGLGRRIAAIVPLPSRTWVGRNQVAEVLAKHLGVPVMYDLLSWRDLPLKRQGELLNNDQRHHNVHHHMCVNFQGSIPNGSLILLDDYIGSGNTIKEAARALRATKKFNQELIPFTVAALKWHLGKPGFA